MKLIPLTQGKFAIVDDEDYDELAPHRWHYHKSGGYGARIVGPRKSAKTILMHRQILEVPHGMHTDHKNGDGLDNRRCNLRVCRQSENAKNRKLNYSNTSGAKGVRFDTVRKLWESRIRSDKIDYYLGWYNTKEEAVVAYDVASRFLHGEFARPNVVR